jgi:hypothetical protein
MSSYVTSDAEYTPPRKKRSILWWIAGFFFLLLLLFFYQLFGPNPAIFVSKQTTFITEPLAANGLPDYEQYVLDISREGVTPENNAVALLWRALFPGEVDPQFHAAVAAELGLDEIPLEEDALTPLHHATNQKRIADFLSHQSPASATARQPTDETADDGSWSESYGDPTLLGAEKLLDQVGNRSWTSEQIPPLADWVAANQAPLDLIVEASRRPRYYAPSPTLLNQDREMLIAMLLPHAQSVREAGRSLPARAMNHVGEGRLDEAWQDILAVHRLSRHVAQGHVLVEQLVAIALNGEACEATLALLGDPRLTADQARRIQNDLAALPTFSNIARCLGGTERLSALDTYVAIGTGGGAEMLSAIGGDGSDFGDNVFNIVSVDWNLVLRESNRWYDRLEAAARLPDREQRDTALAQIEADLQQMVSEVRTPSRWAASVVSRQQRSQIVSEIMLALFLPAVTAASEAQDRGNTTFELVRRAAALAAHRVEHGAYPDELGQLKSGDANQLPTDLYSGKAFIYKPKGNGYLLYSVGANGVDDGGSNQSYRVLQGQSLDDFDEAKADDLYDQIPTSADDISILMPRPAFELPKLQTIPQ